MYEVQNKIYLELLVPFSSGKRVAIIGSGLAGAATAIALRRQGFEPTLYDKVDPIEALKESIRTLEPVMIQFGEMGGDLCVMGNGNKALQHLGLASVIDEISVDNEPLKEMTFALLDGSDRIPKKTQKGDIAAIPVLRSKLHAALMRAAYSIGIKAFGGKKIKNLTQTDDEVTVEFEDGSQVVADIVVGADGIHSVTRQLLFPNASKPEVFATGHIGVVDRRTLPDGTEIDFDCQRAIYGDPVNSRFIFGARCEKTTGAFFVADLNATKPLDGGDDWRPYTDLPKESSELADLVASWGAAQNVVNCIRYAKRINPANLYDLPNLSTFYKGRVVLVGDAAHGTIPFYGQGLNQAFEDAGVLGDLLGHFQDKDYGAAFAAYDQIRVPRAHLCAAEARKNAGRMKASNHVQMKIGRFVMRLVFTIMNAFGVDDEVYYHDFRDDVIKTIPGIQLK